MNKIHLYDKIISPVVTEKSTNLSEFNKFEYVVVVFFFIQLNVFRTISTFTIYP